MARIHYQVLREQASFPSLFSNQSSMDLFAREKLEPVLIKIFKDLDCDIYLENYTELQEDLPDDWGIESVDFNFLIPEIRYMYGKCYITFENGILVTIDVKVSEYRDGRLPDLPGSDDIIKSVLKYNKKPIIFPFTSPGLLLDTFAFLNDVDGVEAVLGAYKSAVGIGSINCALYTLAKKEEINGEMVALLLEFKNKYFGFDEAQSSSLL